MKSLRERGGVSGVPRERDNPGRSPRSAPSLALQTTVDLDLAEYVEGGRCTPRESRELPPLGDPSYIGVHTAEPGWRGTYTLKPSRGRFASDPPPWRDPMECDCAVCKPMAYPRREEPEPEPADDRQLDLWGD